MAKCKHMARVVRPSGCSGRGACERAPLFRGLRVLPARGGGSTILPGGDVVVILLFENLNFPLQPASAPRGVRVVCGREPMIHERESNVSAWKTCRRLTHLRGPTCVPAYLPEESSGTGLSPARAPAGGQWTSSITNCEIK